MADLTLNSDLSSVYSNDPEAYVTRADSYKGLLALVPKNLPQNNIQPGNIQRTFYGMTNGALFANNPSMGAEHNCGIQYAYAEPLCQK